VQTGIKISWGIQMSKLTKKDRDIISNGVNRLRAHLLDQGVDVAYLDSVLHNLMIDIVANNDPDKHTDFIDIEVIPYKFKIETTWPEDDWSKLIEAIPFPCEIVELEYKLEIQGKEYE
jgi:hypothetical protein